MVGGIVSQVSTSSTPWPRCRAAHGVPDAGGVLLVRPWWRRKALLACYPLAMGFALLYGGEHYLVDEIAGVAYALVARWLAGDQPSPRHEGTASGARDSEPTAELAKP